MADREQIIELDDGLSILAPAKINMSLLIAGKRPDGFHEIETIIAKIDLFDEILLQHSAKNGIEIICKGPYWAPEGEENLVWKACKAILDCCGISAGLKITLIKNIPAGTGLGSASSDAAATLIGVNNLLNLSVDARSLGEIAAGLGSDVAFFLGGPLACCTGRGEKIKAINKKFNFTALLILTNISVSTKKVYENYRHDQSVYNRLSGQIKRCIQKNSIDLAAKMCANMLQLSCFSLHNELAEIKAEIESFGIGPLCMSGSGSSLFLIINDEEKTTEYCRHLEKIGCKGIIVRNNRW